MKTLISISANFLRKLVWNYFHYLLYIALFLALIPYYRYQINPDGVSYLSIANHYIKGDFYPAINGYFSPLISWLLSFFLIFTDDGLLAFKLCTASCGLFTLRAVDLYVVHFRFQALIRLLSLFVAVFLTLFMAFRYQTTDLLGATLLLYYLFFSLKTCQSSGLKYWLLAGMFGGFAYLAKSYCLPYFLIHFGLTSLYLWLKSVSNARFSLLKNAFFAFCVWLCVCLPWIALISLKYEKFIYANKGAYNYAFTLPNAGNYESVFERLSEPPYGASLSIWEDPSFISVANVQTKFSQTAIRVWQIERSLRNLALFAQTLTLFSFALIPILALALGFGVFARDRSLLFLLSSLALYASGYMPFLVEDRYFWLIALLELILVGRMLFYLNYPCWLALIFYASFLIYPCKGLISTINIDKITRYEASQLSPYVAQGSRIVSAANWAGALHVSYYLQTKLIGIIPRYKPASEICDSLQKYKVQYYFVYGDTLAKRECLRKKCAVNAWTIYELE